MRDDEITELFDSVVEMTTDPAGLVRVAPELVDEISTGDPDPKFATFVIESGWSKSKRFWGPELFNEVASEINVAAETEPIVGYLGHIKPDDDPYTFPEIQLQWVGAKLLENTGSKAKLAVKAYVLPNTKGREYLEKKLVRTVSWRGKIAQELFEQGVRVKKFAIESIDLARPRAAGMSARLAGALTSEMEKEGGNSVKPEEIAALQENELRAHNPGLVDSIEARVRDPLTQRVSEMENSEEEQKPLFSSIADLRKLLGLGNDVSDLDVISKAVQQLKIASKKVKEQIVTAFLEKKLKATDGDSSHKLVHSLVASEMSNRDFEVTGDADTDEQVVSEIFTSVVDGNSNLKETVAEMMDAAPASPPNTGNDDRSGERREIKPGYESQNIRVRSAG
jgi:hypothetical protein